MRFSFTSPFTTLTYDKGLLNRWKQKKKSERATAIIRTISSINLTNGVSSSGSMIQAKKPNPAAFFTGLQDALVDRVARDENCRLLEVLPYTYLWGP